MTRRTPRRAAVGAEGARSGLAVAYLRWAFARALLARGYWSTTAVYLVVVARLEPFELVLIGVFQSATALVAEVPAGVFADTVGRRTTLTVAHLATGVGMAMAGLVTAFPLLVVSQCLWGIGWALASGADVAWLTDELGDSATVDRTMVAQTRWELVGSPLGMIVFAALAAVTTLSGGIVTAGVSMAALGLAVARWPEAGFEPTRAHQPMLRSALTTFRAGANAAMTDAVTRATLIATAFVFGGVQALGRLREQRLLKVGIPTHPDPVVWFAALGVIAFLLGALAHRQLERSIANQDTPRLAYASAALTGAMGLTVVAHVGNLVPAAAGVIVVMGVADPVIRTTASVVVNRRTSGPVRATVQSLLWQSGHLGVIVFGLTLAALAAVSPAASLSTAAALLATAALLVARTRDRPTTSTNVEKTHP